jgi:phage gp46-like protein
MRIIPLDTGAEPSLSPDLLIGADAMGDLALAMPGEPSNRGGLAARQGLLTAVTICLMSDARARPEELRDGDVNRGWPGDSFDLADGAAPIGSKLWLLRRRTADEQTARQAEAYAIEALQPLVEQGAAALATATAAVMAARNGIELTVTLTDRAGRMIVAPRFRVLWDELSAAR